MTGPKVLRGRETSMLWFGISGVWMAKGVLGMTPKLERGGTLGHQSRGRGHTPLGFHSLVTVKELSRQLNRSYSREQCALLTCSNTGYNHSF